MEGLAAKKEFCILRRGEMRQDRHQVAHWIIDQEVLHSTHLPLFSAALWIRISGG